MRRVLSVLTIILFFQNGLFAQFTQSLQYEDFSSYTTGDISSQSNFDNWVIWPNASRDGIVTSNTFFCDSSNPNIQNENSVIGKSLLMDYISSNNIPDVLYLLGNRNLLSSNYHQLSFNLFIPSGRQAYYSIQQNQNIPNPSGQYELFFGPDGSGEFNEVNFSFPQNQWFNVCQTFFKEGNNISILLTINGEPISLFTYSSTSLGAINFYTVNSNYLYYVDCISLSRFDNINCTLIAGDTGYCHNGINLDINCDFNFCVFNKENWYNNGVCPNPCRDAETLACGNTLERTTVGASNNLEIDDYACHSSSNSFNGPDQIFEIQKTSSSGRLIVNLFSDDLNDDLDLFILNECGDNINCIGRSTSGLTNLGTREFSIDADPPLPAGTYYAVVDGFGTSEAANFRITATCEQLSCNFAQELTCDQLITHSNGSSANTVSAYLLDGNYQGGLTGGDRLYYITLEQNSVVSINLDPSSSAGDLDLFLLNSCDEYDVIAFSTNSGNSPESITTSVALNAGTYYVMVDGWDGSGGSYDLIASWNCNGSSFCDEVVPVVCGDILTNQSTVNTDNLLTDYSCVSGTSYEGNEKYYSIEVTEERQYKFFVDVESFMDTDIFILDDCGGDIPVNFDGNTLTNCIASSTENYTNSISKEGLDVVLTPGTYYIIVDGKTSDDIGLFDFTVSCDCTCIESASSPPIAEQFLCDNFEDYQVNQFIDPQSTRWTTMNTFSSAAVFLENGNQYLDLGDNGELMYDLENNSDGRYRLSWRTIISSNHAASYNLLYDLPSSNGQNGNVAYQVEFLSTGQGNVYMENSSTPIETFVYYQDVWNTIVQIIDLNTNRVELWINNAFIGQWDYNGNLGGLRFEALGQGNSDDNEYKIDDFCMWKADPTCSQLILVNTSEVDDVCIDSGRQFEAPPFAQCELYTSSEWSDCYSICDLPGTTIHRTFDYNGEFSGGDFDPAAFISEECVLNEYGGTLPTNAKLDLYSFYNGEDTNIDVFINTDSDDVKGFIFTCECIDNDGEIICGQQCLGEINDLLETPSLTENNGFYSILIIGLEGDNYGINVFPNGLCQDELVETTCNTTINGTFDQFGDSDFDAINNIANYNDCYNGTRAYSGIDTEYRFFLDRASEVTITLESQDAELGLFMYGSSCGRNCIAATETPTGGGQATISDMSLTEGYYYFVVDKNSDTFTSDNYTISISCGISTFTILFDEPENTEDCLVDANASQSFSLFENALTTGMFNQNHEFYFMYKDQNNNDFSIVNEFWNQPSNGINSIMQIEVPADDLSDSRKCSYINTEAINIVLCDRSTGNPVYYCTEIASQGNPNPIIFDANSTTPVTYMRPLESQTFKVEPSFYRLPPIEVEKEIQITASSPWVIEISQQGNWVSIDKSNGEGNSDINISVEDNPFPQKREAVLKVVFTSKLDGLKFNRYLTIIQDRLCLNPNVSISTSTNPLLLCEGDSLTLTADISSSNIQDYSFLWSDGNTGQDNTVIASNGSDYSVEVTDNVCNLSTTQNYSINNITSNPTTPIISGQNSFPICEGEMPPTLAVNNSAFDTRWYDVNGNVVNQGNIFTPNPNTIVNPGNYTFFAEAFNGNCESSNQAVFTVIVNETPEFDLGEDITECQGNTITLDASSNIPNAQIEWFQNNVSLSQSFPQLTIDVNNINTYTAQVQTSNNCTATDNVTVTALSLPEISFNTEDALCNESNGSVEALISGGSGSYSLLWSNNSTGNTITNLAAGMYNLTVTDTNQCSNTDQVSIQQASGATVILEEDVNICAGETAILTASFDNGIEGLFVWNTQENTSQIDVNPISTTTYEVTATDNIGCTSVGTTQVVVNQGSTINLTSIQSSVCANGEINLSAFVTGNVSNTLWESNIDGFFTDPTTLNTTFNFVEENDTNNQAVFTLYAFADNLCTNDTATQIVDIISLPTAIIVNKECAPDLETYSLEIATDANTLEIISGNGIQSLQPNGNFQVSNIPRGETISMSLINTQTDCERIITELGLPCNCSIESPGFISNAIICPSESIPELSVSVEEGLSAIWYDSNNIEVATNTISYIPTSAGTYFVQTIDPNSECISESTTPVSLTILDNPIITFANSNFEICAGDEVLLEAEIENPKGDYTYNWNFSTESSSSILTSPMESTLYEVSVTDINGCVGVGQVFVDVSQTLELNLNNSDNTVCADNDIQLSAEIIGDFESITWNTNIQGTFEPNANVISPLFIPDEPLEEDVPFSLIVLSDGSCPPESDFFIVELSTVSSISSLSQICAPDLESYSINFETDATTVDSDFEVFVNGNNYTISNIPIGESVLIELVDAETTCSDLLEIFYDENLCTCENLNLEIPVSDGDIISCVEDSIPTLAVSVEDNQSANWFDNNFILVAQNTLSYTPVEAGVYFVQTLDLSSNCTSTEFAEIQFIIEEVSS